MARLMSVAYTEAQVRDRTKTVTRRLGWHHAKHGQRVVLCRKVMGRKKGEPLVRLVVVEITDVRREPLRRLTDRPLYGEAEVALEGFPHLEPAEFVRAYFVDAQGIDPDAEVTRIAYDYCEDACLVCARDVPAEAQGDEWRASHYCMPCLNGPLTLPIGGP